MCVWLLGSIVLGDVESEGAEGGGAAEEPGYALLCRVSRAIGMVKVGQRRVL